MVYILFQWCLLFFNVVSFTSVKTAVAFPSQRRSPQWAWPSTSSSCSSSAAIVDYAFARYSDNNDIKTSWKALLSLKLAVEGNNYDSIVSVTENSLVPHGEPSRNYKKNQPMIGVYLLSFPNLYPNGSTLNTTGSSGDAGNTASNWRRKIKRWKQYCLGDGGVYFDERPETLKALNVLLCKTLRRNLEKDERQQSGTLYSDATNVKSVEVAVVSTCARLEFLIVVQYTDSARIDGDIVRDTVQRSILETILEQISYHQSRLSFRLQQKLPFNLFDRPSRIWGNASYSKRSKIDGHLFNELSREVVLIEGVKDVSERLCLIAAGLLDRPLFRPFSSRDSHVMHQLKQSSICAVKSLNSHADQKPVNGTTKYSKTLIDTALQSGKGARSVKVVPILLELREMSNGANGPADLSARAAESAIDLAVRPAVSICISKFKAFQAAESIASFRQHVETFVENVTCGKLHLEDDSCANVRRLLHLATIQLREGKHVDMDEFLKDIASEISLLNLPEST